MCRKSLLQVLLVLGIALAGTNVAFAQILWEGRINSGADDVEESVSGGGIDAGSSDLEITEEGDAASNQLVGLRFNNVEVPQGANIVNAYVQFHVDETDVPGDNRPGTKFLKGEAADNAGPLTTANSNVSSRPTTSAEASWDWPEWLTTHEEGPDQRTSNIAAVIQEITDRPGWSAGNSMVLIITGSGENTAEAFNGEAASAALLHIEYSSKFASGPDPADGAIRAETWASLGWTPGETAVTHDVYMSDNFDDVNDRDPAAFLGNQAIPFTTVGFVGMPFPDGLVPGTTYYWAVDSVEADGTTKHMGKVWSFSIPSKAAHDPSPRDGANAVQTDVELSWTPGFGAKLHAVYFGDDFDTVSNAVGSPPVAETTFTPGALEKDKVYYWRVDELNPPETVKGDVWSFRTLPEIVITDPDLIGWWKLDNVAGNTVLDWSGYGNDGTLGGDPELIEGAIGMGLDLDGATEHISMDGVADDLTANVFTLSVWIKTTMTSGEGVVFGTNTGGSHDLIFGVNDGELWVEDSAHSTFPAPPAINDNQWHMITYVRNMANATVYVDGVQVGTDAADNDPAAETRWSIGQEWDGSSPSDLYRGMVDDVRIYSKALAPDEVVELMRGDPLVAWNPTPPNGRTIDVEQGKNPLSWSPGDNASEHDVYLSLDKDALDLADTSTPDIYRGRQAGTSYSPPEGLPWGTGPYYWRVDEINADASVSAGSIWSFSVADYLIVEDFESYTDNDADNEAIWQHWIDGYGVPANGAQVGYLMPPYAETTIVHSGGQSMPLMYNNTAGVTNSEAELTVSSLRNWTLHDVGALSVWFRGNPASVGSFTEAPVGTFTMTGSGTDITGSSDEFHYAYKMLGGAGSIVARVNSVTNTNNWAKAGVMIRETLDPDSAHAMTFVTPAQGVVFEYRGAKGDNNVGAAGQETGITAPHWVKLERDIAGNFTASHSTNGSNWVPVGNALPERVLMDTSVYVGLALTSHNASATCEAVFSNVTTTGNVTGVWTSRDIGIASNAAEPLYVSVANATGAPAVVAHPDPAAATIDVWTEWVIPLQDFAAKGINLSNIDKMAVGLGTQSGAAAAGGSGTVYVDDFRLYRIAP
ncbi:MAG: LamG domain-containing protein [Planctomycetota bacterium]|jgi:hypothetical protein